MEATFYEPSNKSSKILAFADVDIARGVTVRGFRVVDGAKGRFAAVPSKPVTVDGQTQYKNVVVFDTKEHRAEFLDALLRDYQKWEQDRSAKANTA